MLPVQLCVAALLVVCITHWIYRWRNPKCNGILPPGSMGLPLVGESLQLLVPSNSFDLPPFLKTRLHRYGPIFRTSVAGRAVVVSADPEFNHFIFQQQGRLVESWYLDLFAKLFKQAENRADGAYVHKYVRNLILSHFGVESLKETLLSPLEATVRETISTWSNQESVEVKDAVSAMAFDFATREIYSSDAENFSQNLREKFTCLSRGLLSFPLNIPGTTYNKCLKNRKAALDLLSMLVKKRRASPDQMHKKVDVLDHVLQDMTSEKFLTEDFIVQLMFGLSFVSFETVSGAATMLINLLGNNPLVLEELTAEHEGILKKRENPNSSITWEEYKSMTFTLHVINETLRLGSVSPGLLRRARKDIEFNGYTIPKGWAIMLLSSAVQMNPEIYKDPLSFNPWRWKDLEPSVISKNYMPFGSGIKQCAGSEYTKLFLATFIHVLVTKHRWIKIRGGNVTRNPMLQLKNGLCIKILGKND
ncbi:cytochrome P450 87A3-like [Durio zibethinus]|uniref:Cytochrome P450 87A3-like n=1 Tax=Durio zibethinus TaxID=66656 RepID=A0A6P5XFE9_DURZI|nr:cytochrome P450 87A3-like [Durio zibethinus]